MTHSFPFLLHLETATEQCSVALSQGNRLLAYAEASEPMAHAAQTTVLVSQVLHEAGVSPKALQAISLSKGPGSYTALRVGASVAKGMCFALQIPLIAIDTLESLAKAAAQEKGDAEAWYCPMIDARRMEVYTAIYDKNGQQIRPLESLIVDENSFLVEAQKSQKIVFTGNGAKKCETFLSHSSFDILPLECNAKFLIDIANEYFINKNFDNIIYFSPEYVKNPNITASKKNIFMI